MKKEKKCLNGIMSGLVPVNQMTLLQTAKILNLKWHLIERHYIKSSNVIISIGIMSTDTLLNKIT